MMSAELVEIPEEQRTPEAREKLLLERVHRANREVTEEIDRYDDSQQLKALVDDFRYAFSNQCAYWQRRALKAERQLRMLLPELTAEQRERAFLTLRIDRSRDRLLLSEYEQQIIAQYRRMDGKGTSMIRELFAILAENAKAEGGA